MEELLSRLSQGFGPSGHETKVTNLIKEEIKDYCDEINIDKLGNLIALKKGKSDKKIMYAAHMDEVGLLVTYIDDKGFLRFTNIGGISPYILLGQRIKLEDSVTGIVSCERLTDISKLTIEKMFIDIGVKSKEKAEELVSIGDVGVYNSIFETRDDKYIGKALDDRAGCAVLIKAMKEIKKSFA